MGSLEIVTHNSRLKLSFISSKVESIHSCLFAIDNVIIFSLWKNGNGKWYNIANLFAKMNWLHISLSDYHSIEHVHSKSEKYRKGYPHREVKNENKKAKTNCWTKFYFLVKYVCGAIMIGWEQIKMVWGQVDLYVIYQMLSHT